MENYIPGIYIDNEFDFNVAIALLLLDRLSITPRGVYRLDFDKIQFFLFLIKNPSKINRILEVAEKKYHYIDIRQLYTIESLSNNVDILHDRNRLKYILKRLAVLAMLKTVVGKKNEIYFALSEKGTVTASQLTEGYFDDINKILDALESLQALSSPKLFAILNSVL